MKKRIVSNWRANKATIHKIEERGNTYESAESRFDYKFEAGNFREKGY